MPTHHADLVVTIATTLERVPLLAGLAEEELEALGARLRRRRYRKGEVIFLRGDHGSTFYLIESGRIRIGLTSSDGREATLAFRGSGDFFGEMALLDGEPRSADAVAHEPSELLLLDRADFLQFLEERPRVATRLLAILSRQLRQTARLVEDAAFLDVPGRLARLLCDLAEAPGNPGAERMVIPMRLTQSALASLVGATRESVNKWLGFYERQGWIERDRDRITVLRPQQLRARAQ